jgi:hypothetical protein
MYENCYLLERHLAIKYNRFTNKIIPLLIKFRSRIAYQQKGSARWYLHTIVALHQRHVLIACEAALHLTKYLRNSVEFAHYKFPDASKIDVVESKQEA